MEHTQLLGDTLEQIAWQKAGIIKKKSIVMSMPQPENCLKVIQQRANEKDVSISKQR